MAMGEYNKDVAKILNDKTTSNAMTIKKESSSYVHGTCQTTHDIGLKKYF